MTMPINTQERILTHYQQEGVDHLLAPKLRGKYLAYDPGTGKTVIVCDALKQIQAKCGIILCTAPDGVKEHWVSHLNEWAGIEDVHIVQNTTDDIPDARWIICNYDLLLYDYIYNQLLAREYAVLVADEAHNTKGVGAVRTRRVLGNNGNNLAARAALGWYTSGSPMPNRPLEMYPVLKAYLTKQLGKYADFIEYGKHFCNGFMPDGYNWNFSGASNINEFHSLLFDSGFMIRRTLAEVWDEMPEIYETTYPINVTVDGDETDTRQPTLRKLIGVAKVPQVAEHLNSLLDNGDKQVVVAYHKEVIAGLRERLKAHFPIVIDGSLSSEQKKFAIDTFIHNDACRVAIVQLNSGGTAIDGMQDICHRMFFAEVDWSPGGWLQMVGRLLRFGQKHPIHLVIVVAKGTLDETIVQVKDRKWRMVQSILKDKPREKTKMLEVIVENQLMETNRLLTRIAKAIEDGNRTTGVDATPVEDKPKPKAKSKAKEPTAKNGKEDGKAETKKTDAPKRDDIRKVVTVAVRNMVENSGVSEQDATNQVIAIVNTTGKGAMLDEVPDENLQAVLDEINGLVEQHKKKNVDPASLI